MENKINEYNLPSSVTVLDGPLNGKVYVIGTAHFSIKSQEEVAELIRQVRPDYVVLELCKSRDNILTLDEETILRESKNLNMDKIRDLIRQTNVAQGLLQALLIRLYAQITKELGLAPGGEFRVAFKEAKKIDNCRIYLGDMPIQITLKRGFHSLPWYRKLKLALTLLFTNPKITKEDMEKIKDKDILDSLLDEFGASFPEFKKVLVDERDIMLTHSLRTAAQPITNEFVQGGLSPVTVVGVVGLGHVQGIVNNWNKSNLDVKSILKVPETPKYGRYIKYSLVFGLVSMIGFKILQRNQFLKKIV